MGSLDALCSLPGIVPLRMRERLFESAGRGFLSALAREIGQKDCRGFSDLPDHARALSCSNRRVRMLLIADRAVENVTLRVRVVSPSLFGFQWSYPVAHLRTGFAFLAQSIRFALEDGEK